jgi:hypothetical protein
MHDPLVMAIPRQQLFTEWKKRRMGDAIILDDDRFFHLLKHPGNPGRRPETTPKVDVRVVGNDVAVPVHTLDFGAGGGAQLDIGGMICTRTIGDHEQLSGLNGGKRLDDPLSQRRPAKNDERDSRIHQ